MISLTATSSLSSLHSVPSTPTFHDALPSPSPSISSRSASSSTSSLNRDDEENVTITANRFRTKGKQKGSEDLRLLTLSTHLTELSYSISDIQTRIFEIQELRHQSQSGDATTASKVIDQSLAGLDERLDSVMKGIKSMNDSMEPLLGSIKTPTLTASFDDSEESAILRKHSAVMGEWEAVQKESQILREELKEDKWLTVFRTVTDQADGMMTSLEKAVNRCQDFIYRVQRHGIEDTLSQSSRGSTRSEKSPLTIDTFTSLLDSFEAKKKHYMPATTKVLSIIDKGVQDRVTKNGECLRRHAESSQRWRNLRERISRTDLEMERVRKLLLAVDITPSEADSSFSGGGASQNGFLATPPNEPHQKTKSPSNPFRKLAQKFKGSRSPVVTPITLKKAISKTPSTEPVPTLRHRASLFGMMTATPITPSTPDRPSHKYSQSLTPESSPSARRLEGPSIGGSALKKPAWNSSTRVEDEERGGTTKPSSRRPSITPLYRQSDDVPSTPHRRSASRTSMASSRPWSPITSSVSMSSTGPTNSSFWRPPSRATTPSVPHSPRMRPKTPSHIPGPISLWRSTSGGYPDDEGMSSIERALSPTRRSQTPSGHPPRPPSRSMIPLPSVHIQGASRPGSAMSHYRPDSAMSFRGAAHGAQTPEGMIRGISQSRFAPSAFRDSNASVPRLSLSGSSSRPPSRTGAATPSQDGSHTMGGAVKPLHIYTPTNPRDPLDAEVAKIVNGISHALLVERVDPPLRSIPKEGEEIRAQYAFSNSLARKVVTCKLTTLTRSGKGKEGTTKKVMCRVGGGWQDLHLYVINRQAGL